MPLVVADRVRETTTTTGTGTVTLAGAVTGYQSFSAIGNGNTTYYTIHAGSQWEVGIGTYLSAGPTLSRDTVLESSNAGALVNFSAGSKDVFVTYPAEKSISDGYGTLPVANGGTGVTTLTSGYLVKGNGASAVNASVVYDNGTNVGIGTASPTYKLSVTVPAGAQNILRAEQTGVSAGYNISSNGTALTHTWAVGGGEAMRLNASGNVGIGTNAPTRKLSLAVAGADPINGLNILFAGVEAACYTANVSTGEIRTGGTGTAFFPTFYSDGAERMRITTAGDVGIGTTVPGAKLGVAGSVRTTPSTGGVFNMQYTTANAGSRSWQINHDVQAYGDFSIQQSTTQTGSTYDDRLLITATGSVGIGTTAPALKLDVNGGANFRDGSGGGNTIGQITDSAGWFSLIGSGLSSTGCQVGTSSTAPLRFITLDTERMRIDTNGNAAIGATPSPSTSSRLTIYRLGGTSYRAENTADGYATFGVTDEATSFAQIDGALGVSVLAAGVEGIRLNAGGNVGIGTDNPLYTLSVVYDGSYTKNTNSAASSIIYMNKGRGNDLSPTNVSSGDNLGAIWFSGRSGSGNNGGYGYGAYVGGVADGALVGTSVPGRLEFATTTAGNSSPTERMRINSSGNVGINTTTPSEKLEVSGNTIVGSSFSYFAGSADYGMGRPDGLGLQLFAAGSPSDVIRFGQRTAGTFTERMRMSYDGNLLVGTTTDYGGRLSLVPATTPTTFAGGNTLQIGEATGNTNYRLQLGYINHVTAGYIGSVQAYTGISGSAAAANLTLQGVGGNVGVGTAVPAEKLDVSGNLQVTGGSAKLILYSNQTIASINTAGSAYTDMLLDGLNLVFRTGSGSASERMRIDSAGFVGIGTSSPLTPLHVAGDTNPVILNQNTAGSIAAFTALGVTYGASFGVNADGTYITSDANTVFSVSGSEKVRIDSSGNLLVGKSSVSITTAGGEMRSDGGVSSTRSGSTNATSTFEVYSTGAAAYRFFVDMAGNINATSTSISAISDIRLKENVRDLDTGLDTILALKPRRFDWKEGKGKDVKDDMGFIAQEVEEVLPALIGGWKAGEGEPDDLKSVKAGDLIPVLVKAIQELTARVAQLEGN